MSKTIAITRKPSTRQERKGGQPVFMGFVEFTPTPHQMRVQARYQRYRAQQQARAALEALFDIRPEHMA